VLPAFSSYPSILAISRPFDSLFRVLFTFRSRYLFAIGLGSIFSLGRSLPPAFTQDSQPVLLEGRKRSQATVNCIPTGLSPSMAPHSLRTWDTSRPRYTYGPQTTTRRPLERRFSAWAPATSLAVTEAIAVAFFSCP